MHIEGKTALITGAGGALGGALATMLAQAGAKVLALDLNKDAIPQHASITPVACDVTDASAIEAAIAGTQIDILINNAGILHSAPLVNVTSKEDGRFADMAAKWQQVLGVNLSSVFYVTQLVADSMARTRTKGVIVNISSVSAQGTAGQSAYSASKAGMDALTKVWARELGILGIRSVGIAPGYIDTPSTHKALSEAQLETITERIPLRRLGKPENIVDAVRFVIENDYVNATTLEVDGGFRP